MTIEEREAKRAIMREQFRQQSIQFRKECFLENYLPTDEHEFYDSIFSDWIDRIEKGKKAEMDWINKQVENIPVEYIDGYAEDFFKTEELSNDMYAALLVNIWSAFERMFSNCAQVWDIESASPLPSHVHKNMYKIKKVLQTFENTFGIDLKVLPKYSYANAVRCMANCYKHNGGRYNVPSDYPIDGGLAQTWGIVPGERIAYASLPMFEILISCGSFTHSMLGELRLRISRAH
ncbi:hypothetical protein [Maridesulfovibrio sp.]|uniref:hypothetical protein n=1 Tax=Maridesulfovibrio sp. TaxID=2795000 RepID=UPI0039EFE023